MKLKLKMKKVEMAAGFLRTNPESNEWGSDFGVEDLGIP